MDALDNNIINTANKKVNVTLRHLRLSDYEELKLMMEQVYHKLDDAAWGKGNIKTLLNKFPDGQLCIEVDGKMVAAALALIVDYSKFGDNHTYDEITGSETFNTHNDNGDVLYGIDVIVHPEYRGLRLGRRLYDARKELCENLNLRSIMAGGRMPLYSQYAEEITPRMYLKKVKEKEINDPILNFQLSNEFHVRKIIKNYLPGDSESKDYATLLEWNNIYYQEDEKLINAPRS